MTARPRAVIIGMMGAGKTRVGKEVAHMLRLPFADADVEIEREVGMKIPSYFEEYGEPAFREVEADLIADMLEDFDGIFSLGGGAPMTPSTQHALASYIDHGGRVVYLDADPAEAMERANRGGGRPMLNGNANSRWKKLFKQRDPVFREVANVHVHTRGLTPQGAAKKVIDMVSERAVHVTGAAIEPYDVVIGEGAMNHLVDVLGPKPAKIALIHTQPVQRHSDCARALLRQGGYEVSDIVIPDAEPGKTITVANGIWERLGNEGFTRSDAVVGLGGGAATDLAGFVAATWMRGVRYVNCPTSLLAMVDASVGGKTGINFNGLKNEIGVFAPAACVLLETEFLRSLDAHNFFSGYAEMLKHGLISTPEHLAELLSFDTEKIDYALLKSMVGRSVQVKEHIVEEDPQEHGIRKALNLGHTVGHAFESLALAERRPVLHGYAVAWGLVCELYLSYIKTGFPKDKMRQTIQFVKENYGSFTFNCKQYHQLYELMKHDKKNTAGVINFTLLKEVGDICLNQTADKETIFEMFDFYRECMGV